MGNIGFACSRPTAYMQITLAAIMRILNVIFDFKMYCCF
ncbi:hypothetical protein P20495_1856 [Pseudoalteromonas sp. BSi20495]|nr:hypothetical protein P20495_1856 [Pseudoalteromonas sp. BSi20495]